MIKDDVDALTVRLAKVIRHPVAAIKVARRIGWLQSDAGKKCAHP
jgi:hypothetical protein